MDGQDPVYGQRWKQSEAIGVQEYTRGVHVRP